jgi:transcriptional regulator with XRE-family HTH domain
VRAGLTQAKLARRVGVTQPNYQRWEAGAASVPKGQLKKLAKVMGTTPEALLGRHPPREARLYDDSGGDDLDYYGEVAIHFIGGGPPLVLSISEELFASLYHDLQIANHFVSTKSFSNQTVVIRVRAISDLYFSSEAYDDYGPEHDTYDGPISLQLPDSRDWEIIEALQHELDLDDFNPSDVQRVREMIMITDEQYSQLIADGRIKPESLETEREKNTGETEKIFSLATYVTYQLSNGRRRDVYFDTDDEIYNAFSELVEFGGGEPSDDMILLRAEGRHRAIFINKSALDYVSIPTHRYEAGDLETTAASLEEGE